jgi:hypothetical protein
MNESAPNGWINYRKQERRFVDERDGFFELVQKFEAKQRRFCVVVLRGVQNISMRGRR